MTPEPEIDSARFRASGHALIDLIADEWKQVAPYISDISTESLLASLLASTSVTTLDSGKLSSQDFERQMLDEVLTLCGLPDRFRSTGPGGSVAFGTPAMSTIVAVLSARERVAGQWRMGELVAYVAQHEQAAALRALRVAGLFEEQLQVLPVLDESSLRDAMIADLVADKRPFYVHTPVGNPLADGRGSVPELASVCKDFGAWLHVDGGRQGAAAFAPELRGVNKGLTRVDSYQLDPSGLLGAGDGCSLFYIADEGPMISALSSQSGDVRLATNGADDGVHQLSPPSLIAGLTLWFLIRTKGADGLADAVRSLLPLRGF